MQLRNLRSASTFDEVAKLYERGHVWKNPPLPNARCLSESQRPYVNIRPVKDGYACRYHQTDVVTWTRDAAGVEEIEVQGWTSLSTETFANELTPWNLRFKLHLDDGYFVFVSQRNHHPVRVYEFNNWIKFRPDPDGVWMPHEHKTKTAFIYPDPKALRAALTKTRHFEFVKWLDAVMAFSTRPLCFATAKGDDHKTIRAADREIEDQGVISLLDEPNKWMLFVQTSHFAVPGDHLGILDRRESIKQILRERIYAHHKAIVPSEVDWFDHKEFDNQRKLRSKYHWAVY